MMSTSSLDEKKEFEKNYYLYVDVVYRVCFIYLKNENDTEDAVQEVFLKMLKYNGMFESEEHLKAWLIVTASNYCKDQLKHWWRQRKSIDEYTDVKGGQSFEIDETLELVLKLPEKFKTVVYLYYYEGFNSNQIAEIIHKTPSTVRNYLSSARKILKNQLEG